MSLTPNILTAAGYKPFRDTTAMARLGDWYRGSFQKRFDDLNGKRYFITITHAVMVMRGHPERDLFTPDVQFSKGGTTFNVSMLHHGEPLDEIEAFFETMWKRMECDHYERWD